LIVYFGKETDSDYKIFKEIAERLVKKDGKQTFAFSSDPSCKAKHLDGTNWRTPMKMFRAFDDEVVNNKKAGDALIMEDWILLHSIPALFKWEWAI